MSTNQKIAEIEAEMARTQKNKATAFHLGMLKAKLAKLKRDMIEPRGGGGGGGGAKAGEGFEVTKSGDARVGLIGFPSVGKSTLLTKLTGTQSLSAEYEFTTLTCIPGTVKYKGCKIQLLDLPGIIQGAKDGKGRGRQVIAVARTCNLILITLDASKPMVHKKYIEHELEGFGIRLNKQPPNIVFKKKEKGGISLSHPGFQPSHLDKDLVQSILKEYRISNAEVMLRCDATVDEFIDVIEGNRVYVPCIYVLNMIDKITVEELELLSRVPHYVPICAAKEWNFEDLMEKIWQYLDMIRVYTKPRGKAPDYEQPVVIPRAASSIENFCKRIHKQLIHDMKYAIVWGTSVKHNPQRVGKEHELNDEDVVQIVKKV